MLSEPEAKKMDEPQSARDRLIVALDCGTSDLALKVVEDLGDEVNFYKVGTTLFYAEGLSFVDRLKGMGKKVFLDLKINDIEEQITSTVTVLRNRASFLTIHGNGSTARAAMKGRGDNPDPKLLQVTLLSSLDRDDILDLVAPTGIRIPRDQIEETYILAKAQLVIESNCDGVIASGESISLIRQQFPDLLIVAPGIRPAGSHTDDHKRYATPSQALDWGANYLVVGRPIRYGTPSPRDAALRILDEMESALSSK